MKSIDENGIWYSIEGINPEPWESPQISVFRNKASGKMVPAARSTARHRFYKESVAIEFKEQNPDYFSLGEVPLSVTFYLWRVIVDHETPTGRISKGKLVDSTNCQKALEDGLQGLLYDNDVTNASVKTHIVEQGYDVVPFILIHLDPKPVVPEYVLEMKKKLTSPKKAATDNTLAERDDIF